MKAKRMSWQSLRDHIFEVLAGAAVLGVGTATVTNTVTSGKHDVRIERLEAVEPKIDKLLESQAEINERLGRIEGKLEAQ